NHIHPSVFPVQYSSTTPLSPLPTSSADSKWPSKMTASQPLLRFCLHPPALFGFDREAMSPPLVQEEVIKAMSENADFASALAKYRVRFEAETLKQPPAAADPYSVVLLGTGSA